MKTTDLFSDILNNIRSYCACFLNVFGPNKLPDDGKFYARVNLSINTKETEDVKFAYKEKTDKALKNKKG